MTTAKNVLLTAEDLLWLNSQGVKGELVAGVLHKKVAAGEKHARIAGRVITLLNNFEMPLRIGQIGGTDGGVLVHRNPDTVREPDVYFVSAVRLPLDDDSDGYLEVVPQLAAEIVSPGDSTQDVEEKIRMWLNFAVSMVPEVRPADRTL